MTQDEAFSVLTMGKSVFLTGAAGSGKTHLLNRYIMWLRERGVEPAITASTGIAATHIGGQTVHSWSGVGVKEYLGPYELDRIEQNERLVKRFRATRVLIIDEVSMLSGNTLSIIDTAIRTGLQQNIPFGGMQVVLCGDFFQLPPVVRHGADPVFAFQSEVWHTIDLHVCYLTEQYRQRDDMLLSILNGIRIGDVTGEHREALQTRMNFRSPAGVPHLYTHNVDVDKQNNEQLAALPGIPRTYELRTKGSKKHVEILRKGVLAPDTLYLKKNAAVMFVKNHVNGTYVNGTLGTVVDFTTMGYPVVETFDKNRIEVEPERWRLEDGDRVKAEVVQLPLRLAWAVTIHKSQGMTLDAARIDLAKTFVPGQGYVALSRIRTLSGLYLEGMNDMVFSRHPAVAEADMFFRAHADALTRRLEKTPFERLQELSRDFLTRIGGSVVAAPKARGRVGRPKQERTIDRTRRLVMEQRLPEDIAEERQLTLGTVYGHIEQLLTEGSLQPAALQYLWPLPADDHEVLAAIRAAFEKTGSWNLTPVYEYLEEHYDYDTLRIARLLLKDWRAS